MKLLICDWCSDLFKLDFDPRSCKCGRVSGRYNPDGHTAKVNGRGFSLGLNNYSLVRALNHRRDNPDVNVPSMQVECFVRAHTGPHNPNTFIEETSTPPSSVDEAVQAIISTLKEQGYEN